MRQLLIATIVCTGVIACSDDVTPDETAPSLAQGVDASRASPSVDGSTARSDAATTPATTPAIADAGAVAASGGGLTGACKDADTSGTAAALHAAAAEVLTAQTPCGFSACHTGSRARAGLRLGGIMDLRAQLVDKPSCEAPGLPLVSGKGGAEALSGSFLWIKLAGEADANGAIVPQSSWGASGNCGQSGSEPFGQLMPLNNGQLDESELAPVRNWICAGAPAP